ncbi:MAG: MFS transporter, partial [Chthonomonadales bacterium]
LMPALATEILGIPEGDRRYGWLFSAIGVGALFGAYLVGKCAATKVRGKLMVSGAVFFALALIGISRTTSVWLAIALFFIVGLAAIAQLATANTLTQSLAPDHLRGRAVSAHMFAMAGLQPIGSYIAGFSAKHWGVANSLAIGGLVFLVYTLGVLVLRPRVASLE